MKQEVRRVRLQSLVLDPPLPGAGALCAGKDPGGAARYDTYFNVFACEKWTRYTTCANFRLRLFVSGTGVARLMARKGALAQAAFDLPAGGEVVLPFLPGSAGAVWPEIAGGARLLGGAYEADADARDVRIAVNVCTYRREEYVRRNIAALRGSILENPDSPLGTRLCVFVSDNAGTLGTQPGARVFQNPNAGGAGGFTRGLIEIENAGGFTHVVFMDDDVRMLPESFERLYALLAAMRPEYAGHQVAGAMLRLDRPCAQHEAGGRWRGLLSESLATGLDLSAFADVERDMEPREADYAAWWFACVPMAEIRRVGLPLPLFVRMDDIEYGLRLGKGILTLPGVCVWHEAFERKHSSKTEYYHARNALIVDALRTPEFGGIRLIRRLFFSTLMRFRYTHARMLLKGIEDYLRGPDFLMKADPAATNDSLEAVALSPVSPADAADAARSALARDTRLTKAISLLTFGGALVPGRRTARVYAHINPLRAHLGKRGAVNVVADTGLGFYAKRDNRAALGLLLRYAKLERRFRRERAAVEARWRAAAEAMASRAFWADYLHL